MTIETYERHLVALVELFEKKDGLGRITKAFNATQFLERHEITHIVANWLGTIPVYLDMGRLSKDEATQLVDYFNQQTNNILNIRFREDNTLKSDFKANIPSTPQN